MFDDDGNLPEELQPKTPSERVLFLIVELVAFVGTLVLIWLYVRAK